MSFYKSLLSIDDDAKLDTLFCNYILLGEFELARATLIQIARTNPKRALNFLRLLFIDGLPRDW
jgi:hypothetical protein